MNQSNEGTTFISKDRSVSLSSLKVVKEVEERFRYTFITLMVKLVLLGFVKMRTSGHQQTLSFVLC